jgi:hypothetical protein
VSGPRGWALAAVATLVLAACGAGGSDGAIGASGTGTPSSPTPSTIPRPASTATLKILAPKNGAIVRGSTVDLRVDLQGARIVPATTTQITPDEGHLHVLLDDQLISMTEGLEQSMPDVGPGLHRITVEFVASDHAPFDPRVVAVVAFEVRP